MEKSISDSPLGPLASEFMRELGSGKMLRARLVLEVGAASGTDRVRLLHAAAAVELIHAASLLHDDVIDGGVLRRGAPAFWVEHGVQGAILFGDMLLFKAVQLAREIGDPELLAELIDLTGEVCIAEVEQELVLRGSDPDWETSLSLARRKTGSLFAFSAYAAGSDSEMRSALKEAGYLIGTAYQLCDDMLDAQGDESLARKSLGSDHRRSKTTAATASDGDRMEVLAKITGLLERASGELSEWPALRSRWEEFVDQVIAPVLESYTAMVR